MAKSDILNLENSIAPRLVRILYPIALLLIMLGVIAGLAQGVRTATRIPTPPPMIAPADPAAAQLQATPPGPGMRGQGLGDGVAWATGAAWAPGVLTAAAWAPTGKIFSACARTVIRRCSAALSFCGRCSWARSW